MFFDQVLCFLVQSAVGFLPSTTLTTMALRLALFADPTGKNPDVVQTTKKKREEHCEGPQCFCVFFTRFGPVTQRI